MHRHFFSQREFSVPNHYIYIRWGLINIWKIKKLKVMENWNKELTSRDHIE